MSKNILGMILFALIGTSVAKAEIYVTWGSRTGMMTVQECSNAGGTPLAYYWGENAETHKMEVKGVTHCSCDPKKYAPKKTCLQENSAFPDVRSEEWASLNTPVTSGRQLFKRAGTYDADYDRGNISPVTCIDTCYPSVTSCQGVKEFPEGSENYRCNVMSRWTHTMKQ